MKSINVMGVPDNYLRAVEKELQGSIAEVSYHVSNYINSSRQLVTNQKIRSKVAGREKIAGESIEKKCNIYLPAGYDNDNDEIRYHIMYLLHGVGGNRYEWLDGSGKTDGNYNICNIFDNLIANGDIEPLIIVFPEGRSSYDWTDRSFNSEGTNLLGFYYFDYELRYDLIPFIETQYHTYANINDKSPIGITYNRLHRAIAGLSMGGMQSLNLVLGGYRCDSAVYTETVSDWRNGLVETVTTPGMLDLFAYVGAFSSAPTSSDGKLLGATIASSDYRLPLLYITCGDADGVAYEAGFVKTVNELYDKAKHNLGDYYRVLMKDGQHNFYVWNNGAYNFARLSFGNSKDNGAPYDIDIKL